MRLGVRIALTPPTCVFNSVVEQPAEDLRVPSSIPGGPTKLHMGECLSGQKERTVNPSALCLRWFKSNFSHQTQEEESLSFRLSSSCVNLILGPNRALSTECSFSTDNGTGALLSK